MIAGLLKALVIRIFPISLLLLIFSFFTLFSDPSDAKQPSITSDGSLGTSISIDGPKYTISEGTIHGGNQFHSFGKFNVFEGESATFTGPNSIHNIIGRVTGKSHSYINGILGSEINGANLYLLNPSGVMFGPNARLNLSGSFHVSTADYLRLGDNGIFYAAISDNSVLTMDPPSAFGFLNGNPAGISIDESWLEVPEGETISVVGGGIEIEGGLLSAPSGQMNIASVASTGEVLFGSDEMRVDSIERFGNIRLAESAAIDASGDGGGTLRIHGGKLVIEDSRLSADTWGDVDGGGIFIGVTDSVSITAGGISTETAGEGDAGDITLELSNLELKNGSFITSASDGSGKGGDIVVTATESVTMSQSSMGSATYTGSSGNAGRISIRAANLTMKDSSYIDNSSYGIGNAGDVTIEATDTVSIVEGSSIDSRTEVDGQAGNISISSPILTMTDGGYISTTCKGDGDGGDITLELSNLELTSGSFITSASDGSGKGGDIVVTTTESVTMSQKSNLGAATYTGSSGNAGRVSIRAANLTMKEGSYIDNSSYGIGNAGEVIIEATDTVSILEKSSINSQTEVDGQAGNISISTPMLTMAGGGHILITGEGDGDGGDITLEVSNLELTNGSWIDSSSYGGGIGGDIIITANESITMQASGLGSGTSTDSSGNAGNVSIFAKRFTMTDSSYIDNSSYGIGKAGDVTIEATDAVSILEESSINSQTEVDGQAGNICISAPMLTMADGGHISATCEGDGDGGDITLTVGDLDLSGNSSIATYSSSGSGEGGDIVITATDSFAMQASRLEAGTGEDSIGDGGDITLEVTNLKLTNDSYITSESFGEGNAGNIYITSKNELMMEDSHILTEAAYSDGGNIKIDNKQMVMLINSEISSSVNGGPDTTGGNINIDPEFVILKGSKIIANAFEGNGGDIDIDTDVFLADSNSIIDASSDQGIDGKVDIRAAFSYLSENPASLAEDFRSAVELLREPCLARMQGGKYSSLFVSGRGALPVEPGGLLPSPAYVR